jgi:hypothetical protein
LIRSMTDRRASIIASTIALISGAAASSPETISSARRAKPPTFFPNMTPKVFNSPRISF